jgi:electron transport complex protein RnfG
VTKEMVRLSGILCAITLVVTIILTFANALTKDVIKENTMALENKARQELIPAESFEQVSENIYEGRSKSGVIGYCVTVAPGGYGGAINMIVGVNADGSVSGINIVDHSETPGLGAKAQGGGFTSQFENVNTPVKAVKAKNGDNEINQISGATITSNAVVDGVNEAVGLLKEHGYIR